MGRIKKEDVKVRELGGWDKYAGATARKALPDIYEHTQRASDEARRWYWQSIARKRVCSQVVRIVSFLLLMGGAVLPILAGLFTEVSTRLQFTQFGVAALAVAGLLQAADRIFGWSSGWLRYMTTVTAMETATRKFDLDWASYIMNKPEGVTDDDKRPLFELGRKLEDDISKLQSDETDKWATEFNSSLALLSDLIKSQRESTEKAAEAARSAMVAQESATVAREKAQQLGGIEMSILHKAEPVAVKVRMDSDTEASFTGTVWSKLSIAPGFHTVHVTTAVPPVQAIQKIVDVPAGGIAHVEVKLT